MHLIFYLFCIKLWNPSTMLEPNYQTALLEAGLDEAGRGCYAGPVFAAAVILPANFYHPLLNDSKNPAENPFIIEFLWK